MADSTDQTAEQVDIVFEGTPAEVAAYLRAFADSQ